MFLCSQDSSTWISQNRTKINMLKTLKLMFSAHFALFTLIPMIIFTFYPCILNSVHNSSLCSSLPLPKLFTCASWESLFCVRTNSFMLLIKTISYSWYVWLDQNYHMTIFSKTVICSSPGLTTSTPYSRAEMRDLLIRCSPMGFKSTF